MASKSTGNPVDSCPICWYSMLDPCPTRTASTPVSKSTVELPHLDELNWHPVVLLAVADGFPLANTRTEMLFTELSTASMPYARRYADRAPSEPSAESRR